jgi:hypothetical protein
MEPELLICAGMNMQPFTPIIALLIFFTGIACGALVTIAERQSRLQHLKLAFQTDLDAICARLIPDDDVRSPIVRITESEPKVWEDGRSGGAEPGCTDAVPAPALDVRQGAPKQMCV